MDSFYAGLPGTPFILKRSFDSIADMQNSFNDQEKFKDVFYGEFCIIDTENKRDPDNGKVFRRGYNGAQYIGKISGGNGLSIENLRIITHGSESGQDTPLYEFNYNSEDLISGQNFVEIDINEKKPDTFEDNFQYIVYDVVDEIFEHNGTRRFDRHTCFLGFYDVLTDISIDKTGKVTYKYTSTKDRDAKETINWIESAFFNNDGTLNITFNNGSLFVNPDNSSGQYKNNGKDYIQKVIKWINNVERKNDGTLTVTFNTKNENGNNDTVSFDKVLKGIDNIELDEHGVLTVTLNTKDENGNNEIISFENKIKWIEEISIDENSGHLVIEYNTGDNFESTESINSIQDVYCDAEDVDQPGTLYVRYEYPLNDTQEKIVVNDIDGYWVSIGQVPAISGVTREIINEVATNTATNTVNNLISIYDSENNENGLLILDEIKETSHENKNIKNLWN